MKTVIRWTLVFLCAVSLAAGVSYLLNRVGY